MQQSLISMINGMLSQVLNGTNLLPNMNDTLIENNTNIKDLQKKIGNDTDKEYGTLFHYSYWSMIRSEQSNNNTLSILNLLTNTNTTLNSILDTSE